MVQIRNPTIRQNVADVLRASMRDCANVIYDSPPSGRQIGQLAQAVKYWLTKKANIPMGTLKMRWPRAVTALSGAPTTMTRCWHVASLER